MDGGGLGFPTCITSHMTRGSASGGGSASRRGGLHPGGSASRGGLHRGGGSASVGSVSRGWIDTPIGYYGIRSTSGQYTSYCYAFLLIYFYCLIFENSWMKSRSWYQVLKFSQLSSSLLFALLGAFHHWAQGLYTSGLEQVLVFRIGILRVNTRERITLHLQVFAYIYLASGFHN